MKKQRKANPRLVRLSAGRIAMRIASLASQFKRCLMKVPAHERMKRLAMLVFGCVSVAGLFLMQLTDMQTLELSTVVRFGFFLWISWFVVRFMEKLHAAPATKYNYAKWRSLAIELGFAALVFFGAVVFCFLARLYFVLYLQNTSDLTVYQFTGVLAAVMAVFAIAMIRVPLRVNNAYVILRSIRR